MTVTGTEQRVYGQLTAGSGGCVIWLRRFKVVLGGTPYNWEPIVNRFEMRTYDGNPYPYTDEYGNYYPQVCKSWNEINDNTYQLQLTRYGSPSGCNNVPDPNKLYVKLSFSEDHILTYSTYTIFNDSGSLYTQWRLFFIDDSGQYHLIDHIPVGVPTIANVVRNSGTFTVNTIEPPIDTGTIVYGDAVPIKNCGHKYAGYLSLLFIASGKTTPYAVFEVHKCASGKDYLFIETYGEVAPPSTPMSLWFNIGDDTNPNWTLLRTWNSASAMSYVSHDPFKFVERKGSSVTTIIDCCKKCTTCGCLTCNIVGRFRVSTSSFSISDNCCTYIKIGESTSTTTGSSALNYGLNNYGNYTIIFTNVTVEYTLNCDTIDTWWYKTEGSSNASVKLEYLDDNNVWNVVYDGWSNDL